MMPHAQRYPPTYTYSTAQWPQQLYWGPQYGQAQYGQWGYPQPQPQPQYAGGPPQGNPYPGFSGYASPKQKRPRRRSLSPPPEVQLHQLLGGEYQPTAIWDITEEPAAARHHKKNGTREKIPKSQLDLPATEPPAHFMRIVCDAFPWDITIKTPREEVITVGLLLDAVWHELQESLTRDEWEEETKNNKKLMHRAMCTRLSRQPPAYKVDGHVKRIDLLMDRTIFMGLKPVGPPDAPEEWLLKVGSPQKKK